MSAIGRGFERPADRQKEATNNPAFTWTGNDVQRESGNISGSRKSIGESLTCDAGSSPAVSLPVQLLTAPDGIR
jgi:hypothetical protein